MKKLTIRNSSEIMYAGKMVCVGRNYADHAKELGNEVPPFPIIFLKPSSVIIFSGENVIHPDYSENLHHEAELVLLIGRDLKRPSSQEAEEAIEGYGLGLDMTLRDLQKDFSAKGEPWTLAKCFDTAAVLSDFTLKSDYRLTMDERITLKVNGEVRQSAQLNTMIFKPAEIVKYIAERLPLERGDLIFTGTPAGVSRVVPGDIIEAEIENIGKIYTEIVKPEG